MTTGGLWMLLLLGGLIIATGLPVWALLLGTSTLFACLGLVTGVIDVRLLGAVPSRLVGLLEHDLLQALPLYAFIGLLLQRMTLADAIFSLLARAFRFTGAPTSLAALGVGGLLAPMNGSVAATASLLSRLVAPRLKNMRSERAVALLSVSATVGVVVPPSLVLLLLGDAMLRAHTEASNLPGFPQAGLRIINTQDLLRSALLPAAALLVLWAVVAWWRGRASGEQAPTPGRAAQTLTGVLAIGAIAALLASVFTGAMLAVEAAATGACLLLLFALLSRAMDWPAWRDLLGQSLQLSGALFALLVGATTFSLVFRGWGTDRWISDLVLGSGLGPMATAALVLLFVAACAWVLDAFEMIFVIIPIVAPALILRLVDAQQSAVLLLLVLQLGFLVPPMGYALLVVQARSGLPAAKARQLLSALLPYGLAQLAVLATVFEFPGSVHWLDKAAPAAASAPVRSEDDIVRMMDSMSSKPQRSLDAAAQRP